MPEDTAPTDDSDDGDIDVDTDPEREAFGQLTDGASFNIQTDDGVETISWEGPLEELPFGELVALHDDLIAMQRQTTYPPMKFEHAFRLLTAAQCVRGELVSRLAHSPLARGRTQPDAADGDGGDADGA